MRLDSVHRDEITIAMPDSRVTNILAANRTSIKLHIEIVTRKMGATGESEQIDESYNMTHIGEVVQPLYCTTFACIQ